jgi:two-component sensor histidine kinase
MAYQQQAPARYGHCDSYFVESHDEGVYAARAEARERARALARMQQRAMAEDLSRATAAEYEEDILDHMEYMEVSRRSDRFSAMLLTSI